MEEGGLLQFLEKFEGHYVKLFYQFTISWKGGEVETFGIKFKVNQVVLAEVLGLKANGEVIQRDNHSLKLKIIEVLQR